MTDETQTPPPPTDLNIYEYAAEFLETEKLNLAARNLQHFIKINKEQVTLPAIVESLKQTLIDSHARNPDEFRDILATQARILDAAFLYYMERTRPEKYLEFETPESALTAQRQMIHTLRAWKKLTDPVPTQKFPKTN